jgi:superfamily II DNA or RNA helicase
MSNLFENTRTVELGPHEFRRSVQRLMLQNNFEAFSIDGPGDAGGDLLCEKLGERWVIQTKWKKAGTVGPNAIKEVLEARIKYDAHQALVVTNQKFSRNAENEIKALQSGGMRIDIWTGENIRQFAEDSPLWQESKNLRPYQKKAFESIYDTLKYKGTALLYLATGMGKTVVAGAIIRNLLLSNPQAKILVLAHMKELIEQLQMALWQDVPLNVPSQLINFENSPDIVNGLTVSTNLSIKKYIHAGYKPDLVIIDECHHVGKDNNYNGVISHLNDAKILGMTATPWRGDGFEIESIFGKPSFTCGIEEGMRHGYLTPVDYRLFCDNINWDEIPNLSENAYSIKQLNKKLFLPQRDDQIIDALSSEWLDIPNPKCIIFCQSVEHAGRLHKHLKSYNRWQSTEILHSNLNKSERKMALIKFRSKDCPILVAVDILNEGVDVPNVNIVCFARVTHSRKIFVQQLGRGLRIAEGKKKVVVLDFAADTRRLAAISNLQGAMHSEDPFEEINLERNSIGFSDQRAKTLIEEWIMDAADLETKDQESVLQFPSIQL